jgi:glycosyltransferase involved in cell wall biosynthesis
MDYPRYDIVVFSHLRWNFVYQRPQHILSRLAKSYNILFIEEPFQPNAENEKTSSIHQVLPNLSVFNTHAENINATLKLVKENLGSQTIDIAWFYSPSFVNALHIFSFDKVVFDCMDELTLFKNAPQSLIEQEKQLMSKSDIVFTGGKSLYSAKQKHHHNVHCFPSSVDRKHFEKAQNGIKVPEEMDAFSSIVVGYYGVVDERIDYELLEKTAQLCPTVDFVLIGPFAKVNPESLPSLPNIHFLGMRNYEQLPNYLKRFDIAMMPFAMNDSTKFISPTKTLEYMAGGKSIISTPVYDVVRDYDKHIEIVENAEQFATAINKLICQHKASHCLKYREILDRTSWDNTVSRMQNLMEQLIEESQYAEAEEF